MPHASEHKLLISWLGDPATARAFAWETEAQALLRFWRALSKASMQEGIVPKDAAAVLEQELGDAILPPADELAPAMRRDGVVIPGLVSALRERLPEDVRPWLHHGATSQDAIDTGLCLRLKPLLVDQAERINALIDGFDAVHERFAGEPLTTVTRLRDALPSTVGHRIANWRAVLEDARLGLRSAALLPVQLGGPVGDLRGFGDAGPAVRAGLARVLDLADPGRAWHTDRTPFVRAASAFEAAARALAKPAIDLGFMVQDRVGAARLAGGASSAMAHKVNPVDVELTVALSRHASLLLGGMAANGLHELERSGIAWTGEWLVLPDLALCAGGALAAMERVICSIEWLGEEAQD